MNVAQSGPPNSGQAWMSLSSTRVERPHSRDFPLFLVVISGLSVAIGELATNPALTAAALLALIIITKLLWTPGEPPALFFVAASQWIQVATKVFHADYYGQTVASMSFAAHGDQAIWLGLIGVIVLAVGMKLGDSRRTKSSPDVVDEQLRNVSIQRVFGLYLCAAVLAWAATSASTRYGALAQVFVMVARIKWVPYYLLAHLVLRRRAQRGYLVVATAIEFISGIGYFSDFRMVFFVLILVFVGTTRRITLKATLLAGSSVAALLLVALAWTGIKNEYRAYLNGGTGQQILTVTPSERIQTFLSMIGQLDLTTVASQGDAMVSRIEYTDFFAAAIDYVPAQRPHAHGALLLQTLMHMAMPRFLFPDKPELPSDSELTSEYTGLSLASGENGTSISLGYMTEDYIDFGSVGMFVVVIGLGLIWGFMYTSLVRGAPATGLGFAFGTALLIYTGNFETAQVKLVGGMFAGFLVFSLLLRMSGRRLLAWLVASDSPTALRTITVTPPDVRRDAAQQ